MTTRNGRTIGRVAALAIPVGVLLSLAACVVDDGPTGLVIVQDQWIEGTGTCTIPGTATPERRGRGILDLAVLNIASTHYLFYPLVENTLASFSGLTGAGTSSPAEEKNAITMTSFHVKLDVPDGTGIVWASACPGEFDYPLDTWLLAPGAFTSEVVMIIRACNAASLLQYLEAQSAYSVTVTATLRAKGHLGGGDIESPPFRFPVDVCYGCLQTGYSDPAAAPFNFPNIARCSDLVTNPYLGDPCNPAQDTTILCCAMDVDAQGQPTDVLCPAVPTGAAKP